VNTTGIVVVTISALAGGGVAAGGIVLGRAVHDLAAAVRSAAFQGYSVTASVKAVPRPEPKTEPAAAAEPVPAGSKPARSPHANDGWKKRGKDPVTGQFLPATPEPLREAV